MDVQQNSEIIRKRQAKVIFGCMGGCLGFPIALVAFANIINTIFPAHKSPVPPVVEAAPTPKVVKRSVTQEPVVRQPTTEQPVTTIPEPVELPPHVQMAQADGLEGDQLSINRYGSLLRDLNKSCRENGREIAKLAIATKKMMYDVGVGDDILPMLETINRAMVSGRDNEFKSWCLAYYASRKNGYSREETEGLLADLVAADKASREKN